MISKVIKIILVILCMISIFLFSSDDGDESTDKSDGVINTIVSTFVGRMTEEDKREEYIEKYSYIVRKIAHFTIYFILGFLLISLLSEYMKVNKTCILISLLIAFLYACSDEVHQLFVPGRSGNIIDVLIDSAGAFVGINIYYFIYRLRRKSHE